MIRSVIFSLTYFFAPVILSASDSISLELKPESGNQTSIQMPTPYPKSEERIKKPVDANYLAILRVISAAKTLAGDVEDMKQGTPPNRGREAKSGYRRSSKETATNLKTGIEELRAKLNSGALPEKYHELAREALLKGDTALRDLASLSKKARALEK